MHYFDTNKIYCYHCKHLWILASDKAVDEELLDLWIRQTIIEHEAYHTEWKKKK